VSGVGEEIDGASGMFAHTKEALGGLVQWCRNAKAKSVKGKGLRVLRVMDKRRASLAQVDRVLQVMDNTAPLFLALEKAIDKAQVPKP
jgi:hypothetical protein